MQKKDETREPAGSACLLELAPAAPCRRPRSALTRVRQERGFLVCAWGKHQEALRTRRPKTRSGMLERSSPCRGPNAESSSCLPLPRSPVASAPCRLRCRVQRREKIEGCQSGFARNRANDKLSVNFCIIMMKKLHKQYKLRIQAQRN